MANDEVDRRSAILNAAVECFGTLGDDISVVGFDNQEVISAHMHPALTTVGLPQYDLGVMGVRTLLRRCGADNDESEIVSERFKPVHVQCPAVPRDSVRTL